MLKINISEEEFQEINNRKKKVKDKKIFRRLQFLYLKYKKKTNTEIADIVGVCSDTITNWSREYQEKGLDEFCILIDFDRRSSKIDPYIEDIKKDVKDNMISTLAELQALIKKNYDIKIGKTWTYECCKKNSICLVKKRV
ncbi:helix-turn-helix domain-containing protein [Patescibacteria group bacterium]|nr:helix-turn-helix domain-containing protein [Patescibacteria group bacterium]